MMRWRMPMRAVFFVACFCFLAAVGRSVYADASAYHTLATIDGTGVGSPAETTLQVFDVPPLLDLDPSVIVETAAPPVEDHHTPPDNFSRILWGYEASLTARLLAYNIGPPVTPIANCFPDPVAIGAVSNGRGVAFDPLDGNLWITRLTGFIGDGFIHKVTPPNVTPGICPRVDVIPFGDGPGGVIQDDIGALDVDEATKHIWAAGYTPRLVPAVPGLRSFIYLVNRNNGSIIRFCHVPFGGGGVGNDTLSVFRATDLPGSSKYLLTDAGEPVTPNNGNTLLVIDQADCHSGAAVTPVAMVPKSVPMTGIDFEWPGLLSTTLTTLHDHDDFPFTANTFLGFMSPSGSVEDISLCGFRAVWEGDGIGGNDRCPY
jgi:hypothetical protein